MQTAVVIGIVLAAAVFVVRSFLRKARGRESCGCDACALSEQCGTGADKPDTCSED